MSLSLSNKALKREVKDLDGPGPYIHFVHPNQNHPLPKKGAVELGNAKFAKQTASACSKTKLYGS